VTLKTAAAVTPVQTVRFNVPALPDVEGFLRDAREIVESGWLAGGPYVNRLETELQPWTASAHVVAVTNATNGLIAALTTLGEPGAEAIVPGYTFLATWQTVLWARMTPVVADVDERGLLDPAAAEAAITPRTRVIMPVHLTGQPARAADFVDIARRAGVALVFDAAHALGARYPDRSVGSDGDAEVFSIGATKPLGAGEGGFITARQAELEERLRRFAYYGSRPGDIDTYGPGMNLRVPELTAALALRALPLLDAQLDRRQWIHEQYEAAWNGLPLRLSGPRPGERSAHKEQMVWLDDPADRAPLVEWLAGQGIETRAYHSIAIPDLTAFEGRIASADRARWLAARSFAVPMHGRLTDDEVARVADGLTTFYRGRQA
jgi:UDP-2-acetamido-2-deoxy-ribo-hexuluronate aminotransferase